MKRYLLFGGSSYYPAGGWKDFLGSYDSELECLRALLSGERTDWYHVIDSTTGEAVA